MVQRRTMRRRRAKEHVTAALESLESRVLMSTTAAGAGEAALAVSAAWFANLQPQIRSSPDANALDVDAAGGDQAIIDNHQWLVQLTLDAVDRVQSVSGVGDLLNLDAIGGMVVRGLGLEGLVLVQMDAAVEDAFVIDTLTATGLVDYVLPNGMIQTNATPSDSRFGELWAMNNTGQTGGTSDADIDAVEAWNLTTGSRSIVVGVIDSGVDYTHPDLIANIWTNPGEIAGNGVDDDHNGFVDDVHGYDFADDDGDPMDLNGHGTHVAGTIGATANNNLGVAGVNWASSIMALRFLDANGSGSTADAVRAINYATMMKTQYGVDVRVTNNSWGGGGYNQALRNAIVASGNAGILFVAAAGNNGNNNDVNIDYPSGFDADNIIAVAATNYRDQIASWSNYGQTTVELAAPGVSILSTVPGGGYAVYSGTSMAAPHVSGAAALAFAYNPGATWQQVKAAIVAGVDPVAGVATKTISGGRLNVLNSLNLLGEGDAPAPDDPPVTPPTPPTPPPTWGDAYEENDTVAAVNGKTPAAAGSANLGAVSGRVNIADLNTLDDNTDWFRFEIGAAGASADAVQILFDHARGDLDLYVYDALLRERGRSIGVIDNERVSLAGFATGTYYVMVHGYQGAQHPDYTLTIDAPATQPPAPPAPQEPEDPPAFGVDLQADISGFTLGAVVNPGDTGWVTVTLRNHGDTAMSDQLDITLYAGDQVIGRLEQTQFDLSAGQSVTTNVMVAIAESALPRVYDLRAVVDSGNDVVEYDETNNQAVATDALDVVWNFADRKFTFTDAGVATTVSLTGGGSGEIRYNDATGRFDFSLAGTTSRSTLRLTTRGGDFTIGDIHVAGSLNDLVGKTTDLGGDLTITGSIDKLYLDDATAGSSLTIGDDWEEATIVLGDVSDLAITAAGGIKTLKVARYLASTETPPLIEAAYIGRLKTTQGRFAADLRLTGVDDRGVSLGSATIAGVLGSGDTSLPNHWQLQGSAGRIRAAAVVGLDIVQISAAASIRSLTFGSVLGASITTPGRIGQIRAALWLGGLIDAQSIGKLKVAGDMTGTDVVVDEMPASSRFAIDAIRVDGDLNDVSFFRDTALGRIAAQWHRGRANLVLVA